jgi:hypothetical protein
MVAENVAAAQRNTTLDYIFSQVWTTVAQQDTVYNPEYLDAGVGVTMIDGRVYYVLMTGYVIGDGEDGTRRPGKSLTQEEDENGVVLVLPTTPTQTAP